MGSKHKHEKSSKSKSSDKKRRRDDDDSGKSRSHKRSKSEHIVDNDIVPVDISDNDDRKERKKKSKRSKRSKRADADDAESDAEAAEQEHKEKRKSKKDKKKHLDVDDDVQVNGEGGSDDEGSRKSKKKNKRSKHAAVEEDAELEVNGDDEADTSSKRKHKKKHKHRHRDDGEQSDNEEVLEEQQVSDAEEAAKKKKKDKSKSQSKSSEKHRKHKEKHREPESEAEGEEEDASRATKHHKSKKHKQHREEADDAMDIDTTAVEADDSASEFPFFTQTVSLYVPLYPQGFDDPNTKAQEQHLNRLVDHYSPDLGGVLLAYRNAVFAENPQRPSKDHADQTTYVRSVDEYAVGFGWLSAEIDLFVPSRNALMEGKVILQSEGHLGLNCWGKFNASIEATRLPRGWTYVDLGDGFMDGNEPEQDPEDQGEEMVDDAAAEISQMHQTGYWVDENKRRVKGTLRFRIKSYEVGLQGDHGFISIEGTMLAEEAERRLAAAEREADRKRKSKNPLGPSRREGSRGVPEFSMTKLGKEEEEEDSGQRQVLYKGSVPGSPN